MAQKPTFLESGGGRRPPLRPPARPLRYRHSASQRRTHAHAPCKLVAPINFRYVGFLFSHFPPKYRFFGKYFKNGRHCFKSMAYLYSTRSGDRAHCHQIDNFNFSNFCAQINGQNAGPRGKFAQKARTGPVVRTQIPLSVQKLIKRHLHVCTMLGNKKFDQRFRRG